MEVKVLGEKKREIKGVYKPASKKMLLLRWAVAIVVIAVLVWLSLAVLRTTRKYAGRSSRMNNMKQVGIGLSEFSDTHRRLPTAVRLDRSSGRPLASWRYDIINYVLHVEHPGIVIPPNKRWDDPALAFYNKTAPELFCFSPDAKSGETDSPESRQTNVMAITGPDTAFDGQKRRKILDLDNDMIVAVEVAKSGVHWMEPGDISIDKVPPTLTKGISGDGFCVLFADGAVWFLRSDVPLDDVKKFFTIESSKKNDREKLLGPYASAKQ